MKKSWRRKIYEVLDPEEQTKISKVYDSFMLVCIVVSLIPLAFREQTVYFEWMDKVSVVFFIIDYILRWFTADYLITNKPAWKAFLLYPFTPFAIIDLLSIIPSFVILNRAFKLLRVSRLLKVLRVFKFLRYSRNIRVLTKVMRKEKSILMTVCFIAIGYIFVTALIMFNVEDSIMFEDFFDALYWATTTLTTVGYGDIYPATNLGRVISMFSLPAAVIRSRIPAICAAVLPAP